jgi:hypothetical protein
MKTKPILLTGLTAGFILSAGSASAQIVALTNGDFGTGSTSNAMPAPWYETGDWASYTLSDTRGGWTGLAGALGEVRYGYFYQDIGTYDGEVSVTINGTAFNFNDGKIFGEFDVGFYFTSGTSFSPASGTDIAGSGTLIGSQQVFAEGVNLPGLSSGTTETSSAFSYTENFAASGISTGDTVWVRFGHADTGDYSAIDDLSVTSVVPEPSAFALLAGCFGLTWIMLRRR